MNTKQLLKEARTCEKFMDELIVGLKNYDECSNAADKFMIFKSVMDLVDFVGNLEIDIYNYFREGEN